MGKKKKKSELSSLLEYNGLIFVYSDIVKTKMKESKKKTEDYSNTMCQSLYKIYSSYTGKKKEGYSNTMCQSCML